MFQKPKEFVEEEWLCFLRNEWRLFKETDDEDEDGDGIENADGRWKKIWGEIKDFFFVVATVVLVIPMVATVVLVFVKKRER